MRLIIKNKFLISLLVLIPVTPSYAAGDGQSFAAPVR